MNKHNLLGSALLGFMMAFIVVMPAFASEDHASSRKAIKSCVKAAMLDKKAVVKTAQETFKASERSAIMAWKTAVDAAKGLEDSERRVASKAANESLRASLKTAKETRRQAEKSARELHKDDVRACRTNSDAS